MFTLLFWHDVNELLPDNDEIHYLIFTKDGVCREAAYRKVGIWLDPVEEWEYYRDVIYWAYMPKITSLSRKAL